MSRYYSEQNTAFSVFIKVSILGVSWRSQRAQFESEDSYVKEMRTFKKGTFLEE